MAAIRRISATKHPSMFQPPIGRPCWHRVEDAARGLGVSASSVRRAVSRQTDVRTIHGPAVAGMIELSCEGLPGHLPYYD